MKNSKARKAPPKHIECIKRRRSPIITAEGKEVAVWELSVPENESLLSGWAKSFREHYCLDSEIDALRAGTGLSRKDYLINIIFPTRVLHLAHRYEQETLLRYWSTITSSTFLIIGFHERSTRRKQRGMNLLKGLIVCVEGVLNPVEDELPYGR